MTLRDCSTSASVIAGWAWPSELTAMPPPEIQVTPARDVVKIAARAVAEHDVEAAIAGHDVLLEERLHGRHVVAHDGRR